MVVIRMEGRLNFGSICYLISGSILSMGICELFRLDVHTTKVNTRMCRERTGDKANIIDYERITY